MNGSSITISIIPGDNSGDMYPDYLFYRDCNTAYRMGSKQEHVPGIKMEGFILTQTGEQQEFESICNGTIPQMVPSIQKRPYLWKKLALGCESVDVCMKPRHTYKMRIDRKLA